MNNYEYNFNRVAKFISGESSLEDFNTDNINVYRDKDQLLDICKNLSDEGQANVLSDHINEMDFNDKITQVRAWRVQKKGKIIGHGPMAVQLNKDSITYQTDNDFANVPQIASIDDFEKILKLSLEKEERSIREKYSFSGGVLKGDVNIVDFLKDKMQNKFEQEIEKFDKKKKEHLKDYYEIKAEYKPELDEKQSLRDKLKNR